VRSARNLLALVDEEFRANRVHLTARPTRFYVNLTERCNLRCLHCITNAPELTASGRARNLDPSVLDALTPHLAHACYLGLSHAGEPTTAPSLIPLLERLRDQRAGEPTVVHLLTNGATLSKERFVQLSELGVTSWSISLDGMHEQSHDLVRLGSSIERLKEKLRAIAAVRAPHVRMGVAWTCMRSSSGEVEQLVRFAASIGLDWIKLEELVPVNAFARSEMLDPIDLDIIAANATALGDELGIRIVDHTRDRPVWKCALDAGSEMRRFSEGDDFANRMEINPCRLPWEVVCIEPNGDVRPLSFTRPVAGNLLAGDLGAIWNSLQFSLARTETFRLRPCQNGTPTCGADVGPTRW
jgi:MoaA/NifB/PqqE/SkfB family radical SAM enzyme